VLVAGGGANTAGEGLAWARETGPGRSNSRRLSKTIASSGILAGGWIRNSLTFGSFCI
jgi:hypothetical protein